jgi:gamma-glutamylcyclotransferase (GGCT)/AIG2-like uncharacterized protein YtfP
MHQGERALRDKEAKWLFCYGTLRDNSVYEQLTQTPEPATLPATLHGWNQFNVPGATYPGAVPSRLSGALQGELRPVKTASTWDILDEYEGNEYLRVPCVVQTAQGSIEAQIYQYDLEHCHHISDLANNAEWTRIVSEWYQKESHLSRAEPPATDNGSIAVGDAVRGGILEDLVMLVNDVPIGSARLTTRGHPELPELTPWMAGIYVIPELRRLGLGTLLVEAVVKKALESGISEIYLHTEDRQSFFARLGWRKLAAARVGHAGVSLMHRRLLISD